MKKIEMPTKETKNFSEVFEMFIISQTAKGVADVTIRNYRYHMKNMSHYFDTEKPLMKLPGGTLRRWLLPCEKPDLPTTQSQPTIGC